MVKFRMFVGDKMVIGLGITDINIKNLKQDKPIAVKGKQLGIEHDILIFWGKDEKAMYEKFKKEGLLNEKTKINIDPRLKDIDNG